VVAVLTATYFYNKAVTLAAKSVDNLVKIVFNAVKEAA